MSASAHEILLLNFLVEDKTPKAVPLDQLLARALRALRTHLAMDVAFISELRDARRVFRYVDAAPGTTAVQMGSSDALENTFCQRVIDLRLPELIPDTSRLPEANDLVSLSSQPIGAHVCVPIRLYDGSVYGTLGCFSAEPKPTLNERDLSMMRVFAEMAAEHIEADLQANSQHVALEERVRSVLVGDAISCVYQPIFDLKQAQVVGFESLARFKTAPARAPNAWFADAALVDLDIDLEMKVIERAMASFTSLPNGVYIVFNISPNICVNADLDRAFARAPLERVVLEINEHVSIREYGEIAKVLAPLRERGLRISVDDTGAGISNFRHILSLKPDIIKLHMSLTRGIDIDAAARALTAALVQFATENGTDVIAEGVETAGELKALRALGVMKAQGYFLGRPAPLVSAASLCARQIAQQEQARTALVV